MYQGEQCHSHWVETGNFHVPDGVDAVIRSCRKSSDPDDERRLTYVLFPDGSEVSIDVYKLLGQDSVRISWTYEPRGDDWPLVANAAA